MPSPSRESSTRRDAGIGQRTQARILSHANTLGIDVSEVLANHQGIPGSGGAEVGRALRRAMAALRRRAERRGPAELLEAVLHEPATSRRWRPSAIEAEGRVENLEELVGVAGEFDANRELEGESEVRRSERSRAAPPLRRLKDGASRAAVRRLSEARAEPTAQHSRSEAERSGAEPAAVEAPEVSLLEEFLAQISLISSRTACVRRKSRNLMSLHNAKGLEYDAVLVIGCEEGVPALALARGGQPGGGAPALLRGRHQGPRAAWMTFARRRALHGSASWNLPSRFLDELPEELVDRHVATDPTGWSLGGGDARRRATGFGERRTGGFAAPPPKQPAPPPVPYAVGDDVVHASFGEGVVTSVEAGSVVVVRFAGDGAERKLMADYAPLRKVA